MHNCQKPKILYPLYSTRNQLHMKLQPTAHETLQLSVKSQQVTKGLFTASSSSSCISFVAVAWAPAWTSHQGIHGNEHLALTETRVLGYGSSSQGTWACWSRRETSFLFGSAVFFFCDSILKSVLAVLFKIAFSFSRRRIRVRVLNAERKISICVQDDFTRFFKFSSVKEAIRKFHSCRKMKK